MTRGHPKSVSSGKRARRTARRDRSQKSAGEAHDDDVFVELLTDEDAPPPRRGRRGRRLAEPDAIFWDFWN